MAKRRVITWPEHKKLLQKRHGSMSPEPRVPTGRIGPSRNKAFLCGVTAIEMALEIAPLPEAIDALHWMVKGDEQNFHDVAQQWTDRIEAERGWAGSAMFNPDAQRFWRFETGAIFAAMDELVTWAAFAEGTTKIDFRPRMHHYSNILVLTARYLYHATGDPKFSWGSQEWPRMVEARCAQRPAFTRPGSSDIEMKPPPLLEY